MSVAPLGHKISSENVQVTDSGHSHLSPQNDLVIPP
jgi:hypothetical protein